MQTGSSNAESEWRSRSLSLHHNVWLSAIAHTHSLRSLRLFLAPLRCCRAVAALEFALVITPLMFIIFTGIAVCLAIFTMSSMQAGAQTAALMVATGGVKNLSLGPLSAANSP